MHKKQKNILFNQDFDELVSIFENITKLLPIIPMAMVLVNWYYSSLAETYYNIPRKYFSVNIVDYLIPLMPLVFQYIVIVSTIFVKKYIIKKDDSWFFRLGISLFYSLFYITIVLKGFVYIFNFFSVENAKYYIIFICLVLLNSLYIFYKIFSRDEQTKNFIKLTKDREKIQGLIKKAQEKLSYLGNKKNRQNYDKNSKLVLMELEKRLVKKTDYLQEEKKSYSTQTDNRESYWEYRLNSYKDILNNVQNSKQLKLEVDRLVSLLEPMDKGIEYKRIEIISLNIKSFLYNLREKINIELFSAFIFVLIYVIALFSYGLNTIKPPSITKRDFEVIETKVNGQEEKVAIISEYKDKYVVQKYNIEENKFYLVTKSYFLIDINENQLEYLKKEEYKGNIEIKETDTDL